jgi:hypothetical protein
LLTQPISYGEVGGGGGGRCRICARGVKLQASPANAGLTRLFTRAKASCLLN